jgi:hypothetical protein
MIFQDLTGFRIKHSIDGTEVFAGSDERVDETLAQTSSRQNVKVGPSPMAISIEKQQPKIPPPSCKSCEVASNTVPSMYWRRAYEMHSIVLHLHHVEQMDNCCATFDSGLSSQDGE